MSKHENLNEWAEQQRIVPYLTEEWGIFGWAIVLLPVIALFMIGMGTMIFSWLSIHSPSRNLALLALASWLGVIVAEVLESQLNRLGWPRMLQGAVEEGLEITGSSLFLAAFCQFLRARAWSR